ncbi:MAG: uncharacterized membrane protein YcjF (UPF0283 family) [Pirellulaceae bacterium]|jgi:uncharacterized membrane protein YcjF (UPF0283 family)
MKTIDSKKIPSLKSFLLRRVAFQWFAFVVLMSVLVVGLQSVLDPFQTQEQWAFNARLTISSIVAASVCLLPILLRDTTSIVRRLEEDAVSAELSSLSTSVESLSAPESMAGQVS